MDLALLRTFLAIYRCGSLTRAASILHLSQPAVSQHLKLLERQTGRPLFTRLPRGIAPTLLAHSLARDLAASLDTLEAVGDALRPGSNGGLAGTLLLGGPTDLLSIKVLPTLAPLIEGGLRVRTRTGLPETLLTELADGELDLVLATVRLRRPNVDLQPLFDEDFLLVAAPRWTQRIGPGAIAATGGKVLVDVPIISYAEDLPIIRRYFRHVFGLRLRASPAVVIPDLRGVAAAVAAGIGISVLPGYLVADAVQRGELVVLHRAIDVSSNTLWLATRTSDVDHPRLVAVTAQLRRAAPAWGARPNQS